MFTTSIAGNLKEGESVQTFKVPTVAEQCRQRPDPLTWARAQAGYKSHPHDRDVLVFHFEDGSCLEFDITYTAGKTGRSYEE